MFNVAQKPAFSDSLFFVLLFVQIEIHEFLQTPAFLIFPAASAIWERHSVSLLKTTLLFFSW